MAGIESQYKLEMKVNAEPFILHSAMLKSLSIVESVNTIAPSFDLELSDKGLNLLERLPLVGDESIEFSIGREAYVDIVFTFRAMSWTSYKEGGPESYSRILKLSGLSQNAYNLVQQTRNKVYSNQEGSDVAIKIGKTSGADVINVENTNTKQDWLQPNWTDAQMLRDLSKRCISKSFGSGGYLYFLDRDSFNFISIDKAIHENPVEELSYNANPEEGDVEAEILDYATHGNSSIALMSGGYGTTISYYDFDEKIFKNKQIKPSDGRQYSLGDRLAVRTEQESSNNRLLNYGHVDENIHSNTVIGVSDSVLLNRLNSLIKCEVLVLGRDIYRPGKTIKLYIPSISSDWIFDAFLSGKWLIETVTHYLTSILYLCKLVLVRSGITLRDNIPELSKPKGRVV